MTAAAARPRCSEPGCTNVLCADDVKLCAECRDWQFRRQWIQAHPVPDYPVCYVCGNTRVRRRGVKCSRCHAAYKRELKLRKLRQTAKAAYAQ